MRRIYFSVELDDGFRWLGDTSVKVGVTVAVEMDSEGENNGFSIFYHFSVWARERVR